MIVSSSTKRSESLPRAEIVKVSPNVDNGGSSISVRAFEKAEMPVLEVKARAEKSSRGLGF